MNALKQLGAAAIQALGEFTFKLADVKVKASNTGNVGYRATLSDGRTVTFWDSTMDGVVEAIDDETFKVKAGVQFALDKDGSFGLINPKSVTKGFWS